MAGPLAGLGILLKPSRIQPDPPPEWFEAQRPELEALVPPELPGERPGDAAPPQPQKPQALPGRAAAPPMVTAFPGAPAAEQKPTVFEQKRNDGLKGGARTRSDRSREAAKAADPAVPEALQDAEWQAHHLIGIAPIKSTPGLVRGAAKAGWRTDAPANVAPLPATAEAQEKLRQKALDRKLHDSGHAEWNREAIRRLQAIEKALSARGLDQSSDA